MSIIVQKYGGSSLATNACVRRVAKRVADLSAAGEGVVVVVSARGKTTNNLMELATELGTDPPQRELDVLLSSGEQISRSLVALAIDAQGRDVVSLSGPQAGIRTDEQHLNAEILRVEPERLLAELSQGRVAVVAGFQGIGPHSEITTLGRGGSDTTAVALAAALDADRCEICSDVTGVWSADPRKVPEAQPIPTLGYEEMLELSRQGAGVLHHRAVRLAARTGVEIIARSSFDDSAETHVCATPSADRRFAGVASHRSVLWLQSPGESTPVGLETFAPVAPEELISRVTQLPGNGTRREILVPLGDVPEPRDYADRILETLGPAYRARLDCGTVTAVGRDVPSSPEVETARHRLRSEGFKVEGEMEGGRSQTWMLPRPQVEEALREVHSLLFSEPPLELAG